MLEHPPQLNITQSELAPHVADYFDNLLAQRDAILARYGLTPETAEQFCDLQSTNEDRETILALYENIVYVLSCKKIPSSELLVAERIREQHRIDAFFGKDAHIEVPPFPEAITMERIEQWKQQRFELRYLPPLTLEVDANYPGWKKRPTLGLHLYRILDHIHQFPQNRNNPHLANLAPNQLLGCWLLVDTRPKPNYRDGGRQIYQDDQGIQMIIKTLVKKGVVNPDAKDGRRNFIHPKKIDHFQFWEPFYDYLGISEDEAIIRLPRIIEQSMFGQGKEWNDTDTWEWSEEYYDTHYRLRVGDVDYGGVSELSWYGCATKSVGFRPLVVFSAP